MKSQRLCWSLCACIGFLASCATINATTNQYLGAPHYAPSSPSSVEILRKEPTRLHERLGEILVEASTDPSPSVEKVEQKLRAEAGKLGADAVFVVYDHLQPVGAYVSGPWWGGWVQPIIGRALVAVAIKYQS